MAAVTLAAAGTFSLMAETLSGEVVIDFDEYPIGTEFCTNGGGPNTDIYVVADPKGVNGNVLMVQRENWDTHARIPSISCPKGFAIKDMVMITLEYFNEAEEPGQLNLYLKSPGEGWQANWTENNFVAPAEVVRNEWTQAVFDPSAFVYTEGNEDKNANGTFGLGFGFFTNPTAYYIDKISFYFEKEATDREVEEAKLNKETCAKLNFDFEDMDLGPCPYIGTNGHSVSRNDMGIAVDPVNPANKVVEVSYAGWTQIFLWDKIVAPEGYVFDDLRLVEYDLYTTDVPGIHPEDGTEGTGKNGAPVLKVKSQAWGFDSNGGGSDCGNKPIPVNQWTTVQFYPSAINWQGRTFKETQGEGDAATEVEVTWTPQQTCEEMGKRREFAVSMGYFPVEAKYYVDNLRLYFQKAGETPVEEIIAPTTSRPASVFNLQGICVLRSASESALSTLPAGLYIVNGKKRIIK